MMKRILLLAIYIVFLYGNTLAAVRNDDEIMNVAASVLRKPGNTRAIGKTDIGLRLVRRMPMLSIIDKEDAGFVIVSHDDRFRAVLGYGKSAFPEGKLPCGLEWYLQAMNESLAAVINGSGLTPKKIAPSNEVKPFVEPLIKSDWYQRTPFNDWCPTFINDKGRVEHFWAGCGCTAAAQVMYYYKHPSMGRGQITYAYDPKMDGNKVELSCRFDTVHFEWDKMQTLYYNKRSQNEEANAAVARLNKAVGIATKMQYTEEEGSGTNIYIIANALVQYFGYDCSAHTITRVDYTDDLWMHTLFEELSNGRPVIYSGRPDPEISGHIFLIDGYDSDGLVHINWGWGYNENYGGYFDINYLSPSKDRNYSKVQRMVVNIAPENESIAFQQVEISQPGTLSNIVRQNRSSRLKIVGTLNKNDLHTLRQLGRRIYNGEGLITSELTYLDLSEATLPDNTIPEAAFDSCVALIEVILPKNIESIGAYAFRYCTSLVNIELPSCLKEIGDFAFQTCSYLRNPILPQSLTKLGTCVFIGCSSIDAFQVEHANTHFSTIDGILTDVNQRILIAYPMARSEAIIPSCIDSIGPYAFRFCKNLTEVTIPSNVRVICKYAFMNCYGLEHVNIEEGLKLIDQFAFNNCTALSEVHLPASLQQIGRAIFVKCTNLRQVSMSEHSQTYSIEDNMLFSKDRTHLLQQLTDDKEEYIIPDGVTTIGHSCFRYISHLQRLIIPQNVKSFDNYSLQDCKGLTDVYCKSSVPPLLSKYTFAYSDLPKMKLHVPKSCRQVYLDTDVWNLFGTIVEDINSGDVNGDGKIDMTDAIMIVYASLGSAPIDFVEIAADVNNDSAIDLTDAISVVYMSLGL